MYSEYKYSPVNFTQVIHRINMETYAYNWLRLTLYSSLYGCWPISLGVTARRMRVYPLKIPINIRKFVQIKIEIKISRLLIFYLQLKLRYSERSERSLLLVWILCTHNESSTAYRNRQSNILTNSSLVLLRSIISLASIPNSKYPSRLYWLNKILRRADWLCIFPNDSNRACDHCLVCFFFFNIKYCDISIQFELLFTDILRNRESVFILEFVFLGNALGIVGFTAVRRFGNFIQIQAMHLIEHTFHVMSCHIALRAAAYVIRRPLFLMSRN